MLPQETITRIENEAKELYPYKKRFSDINWSKTEVRHLQQHAYIECAKKYEEARLTQPSFTLEDMIEFQTYSILNYQRYGYIDKADEKQYFKTKHNIDI